MLPSIDIPYSEHFQDHGGGESPCLICGKKVNKKTAKWVVLEEGGGRIVDPSVEPNHGAFPIGPDCWRKNSQLKAYNADLNDE